MKKSALQKARATYQPKLPIALAGPVRVVEGQPTHSVADQEAIKALFPNTYGLPEIRFEKNPNPTPNKPVNVGVILSGGQAPGGHNVICGIFDGIKKIHRDSRLFGFLMGPDGLVKHRYIELTAPIIDEYRNTGGFDIIGSGRTKLEKKEQFDEGLKILNELNIKALVIVGGDDSNTNAAILAEYYKEKNTGVQVIGCPKTIDGDLKKLGITALVIIGGDDSNTNAAILAEYYKAINAGVQVIGCPKTIDGDLKNDVIETSFGFDTATKVYSEVIGNIQRDCNSAKKYWHFIKLMGRSASHIALECALQTQPNICLVSEEIEANNMSLDQIVDYIAGIVAARAADGNNFGTVLIPEGLIEFIPEFKRLIGELNELLGANKAAVAAMDEAELTKFIFDNLSAENVASLRKLPEQVARQLMLDRDPHGNVQVSLIETEKLLSGLVADRLRADKHFEEVGGKFSALHHFFGYEGRCADPSNFDADYCYSLGYNATALINAGVTGYMSSIRNLVKPAVQWIPGGIPITMMMNIERRNAEDKPVIQKALVRIDGAPFQKFAAKRDEWAHNTCYVYPGPIQYFGPAEVCDQPSMTLKYEHQHK